METTLHVNEFNKFHKPKKKKKWSFLIPLKNTYELKYQNHDLQETWVLMKI